MTATVVLVGSRREGLSREACLEHFEGNHLPLLKDLPALTRVRSGVPTAERIDDPRLPGATTADLLIELQFEDPEAVRAAFRGRPGDRIRTDARRFLDCEETVAIPVHEKTLQYRSIPSRI